MTLGVNVKRKQGFIFRDYGKTKQIPSIPLGTRVIISTGFLVKYTID